MKAIRILLILGTLLLASCSSEDSIKREIDKANYCSTKDDCILVGGKCPFGCYIYANQAEASRIKNLVDGYESNCAYMCIECSGVECVNNKCQPVCST